MQFFFQPNGTGSGSGGGGASLRWVADALAPIYTFENEVEVYEFESGITQYLYTTIRVPNGYAAGSPITLRAPFYCNANTGTVLLQTLATLIRPGTDVITSTTNQRTSTNAAVSLVGSSPNTPQAVSFDVTSSTGQINGVSVAAGHLIKIRLTRGTDTATPNAKFQFSATEVTFS